MFRTLLGTMLIASQILNGFWANATLCLRSDGTVCCIHDLAQSCPCCEHDHEESTSNHEEHDCHGHAVCAIADNHEHDESKHADAGVPFRLQLPLPHSPCGCQHQPLTSTSIPPTQKSLSVTESDRKQGRPTFPQVFTCHVWPGNSANSESGLMQSPACMTVGLTIASSIVIRC
jgi:hypothetical protein